MFLRSARSGTTSGRLASSFHTFFFIAMLIKRFIIILIFILVHSLQLHAQNKDFISTDFFVDGNNGIKLYVRKIIYERLKGIQLKPIVLIHGGGSGGTSSFDLDVPNGSFAKDLAKRGFKVYLMNIRGWEKSTSPLYNEADSSTVAASCQEAADDIDAVINHILLSDNIKKVNIFGWATGGHWAAYYTTLHNDKIANLVVLNTLYGVNAPWSLSRSFADPADSNRYDNKIPLYRKSSEQAIKNAWIGAVPFQHKELWIDSAVLNAYAKAAVSFNSDHMLKVPGGYRKESFYMAHGRQYWNARQIMVSVLLIRSEFDFWSRPADLTAFYNDLVNAPLKKQLTIKEASHFVFLDKAGKGRDILLNAISSFIK